MEEPNVYRRQGPIYTWLLSDAPNSALQARMGRLYRGWDGLWRSPTTFFGFLIIVCLLFTAVFAPVLTTALPTEPDLANRLLPPGRDFVFGTDELGRSIYSRIVHGASITLYIVTIVTLIVAPIGLTVGIVAGYFGGWVDKILMRVTDISMAFPRLVLALAFVAALGSGIENAVIAIGITTWPPIARLARADTLVFRNSEFVLASRQQGASHIRILWHDILPMCLPSVIVRMTLDMSGIVLIAAGLGFLGLGAQPPAPEWGAMIAGGREYLFDHWWVPTIPGIAILLVSLGFNLLGDGLRDVMDPRHG